jgi:serine/threonine-protein kinase
MVIYLTLMKKFKKIIFSDWPIGLIITIAFLLAYLLQWTPLQALEYKSYDFRARMLAQVPESPVVIVAIDDLSIQEIGRWPWPRQDIGGLIDILADFGARVIGVDIFYTEQVMDSGQLEVSSIREFIESLSGFGKNSDLMQVYEELQGAEMRLDADGALAASMAGTGNVVLPLFFVEGEKMDAFQVQIPEYAQGNSLEAPPEGTFVEAIEMVAPIPVFSESAAGLGHDNLFPSSDGSVRRTVMLMEYGGRLFPSFALQLVMNYLGFGTQDLRIDEQGISFGKIDIPTTPSFEALIRYRGPYQTYTYIPAVDVLMNNVKPEDFQDKIVLVATTATGLTQLSVTPFDPKYQPIEIRATVIDNILDREFIYKPSWASYVEIAVIVVFGLLLSFLIPRLRAFSSAVVAILLLLIWNGVAIFLFTSKGMWLQMMYPTLLLALGYTVVVSKRFMVTEKRKEKVEGESLETNKMLGLSFQGQGMLDLALEKFMKVPIDGEDETIKDHLYNLALDFERKRQFNKSVSIYEHILTAGPYRDAEEKKEKLTKVGETMIFGSGKLGGGGSESTVIVDGSEMTPTLGRYEVLKELGKGAMGIVYLGRDPKINRQVAIKTVRFDEIEDEEQAKDVKERFFREAEAAGRLNHPNIVAIYDAGEDMDLAYIAMELLDGIDLSDFLPKQKEKRMSPKMAIKIVGQVADGLNYAHKLGIVHRDIKPANIMLLKNGGVKVTDFGIARVVETSKTQTGVVLGTPSYMSPEQVVGKKVDGRSDLFSLGVMLYELLTGKKPFTGDSIGTLMYNIANQPHPPIKEMSPDVPDCCINITDRLMEKDIEKRYQNGAQAVKDLKACFMAIGKKQ